MEELLRLEQISKHFGGVTALDQANFYLAPSEIVGVVGDNGAGKSSLMKILSGVYIPDSGQYLVAGQPVYMKHPDEARQYGIEMVYQDFALIDTLDVKANIFLGREPIKKLFGLVPIIDRKTVISQSENILRGNLELDLSSIHEKVERLSGGQRQGVAIARTLLFNPKVLILDEPTASLSVHKIEKVLDIIRRLKSIGVAVIMISHRLQEIFEVADRVVVMRHGRDVANLNISETSMQEVIAYMVGGKGDQ